MKIRMKAQEIEVPDEVAIQALAEKNLTVQWSYRASDSRWSYEVKIPVELERVG